MSAHRIWRVYVSETYDGNNNVSALDIEFYDENLNPLINGNTTGVIASGSVESVASYAMDGNMATRWSSAAPMPQYIGKDFGSGVTKDVRAIKWAARTDAYYTQAPKTAAVQYSDDGGTTWATSWSIADSGGWSAGQIKRYYDPARPAPSGDFAWRIYVTDSYGTSYHQLGCEVEWLNSGSVDLAPTNIATITSGDEGSFQSAVLYDNDSSTFHQWLGSTLPKYSGVEFYGTTAPAITAISIKAHASFPDRMPKTFKVQRAPNADGGAWVDVATFTNVPSWTGNEKRTYSLGITYGVVRPQIFVCT
jgi:hypothetical protein